jgi:hypothetical protein
MSEHKDEQWLDSQLRRAINDSTPAFDAESWKRRHRREYETLLARRGQSDRRRVRRVSARWMAGLAAVAAVIVAGGLFLTNGPANGPQEPPVPLDPVAKSPAAMMSMRSLRMAYELGGFDALDQQLQNTLDEFGPRSSRVSLQELF